VILRPALPFPLAAEPSRRDSHVRLAVAVSVGLHVAIVAYVAYVKFNPPPVEALPEGPITLGPLVDWKPLPPPDKPQRPPPKIHTPTPVADRPLAPVDAAPQKVEADPPVGPIARLDPAPVVPDLPAEPHDPVIHNPRWVSQPGASEFSRFYPDRALGMGVEGEVELRCLVNAAGQLHDCQANGETPKNLGFAQAALKLSRYMRIAPKTIDGQPVDGGVLVEPIKFRLK
jgi:protein TonB